MKKPITQFQYWFIKRFIRKCYCGRTPSIRHYPHGEYHLGCDSNCLSTGHYYKLSKAISAWNRMMKERNKGFVARVVEVGLTKDYIEKEREK